MKNGKDKDLDDLFRSGLQRPYDHGYADDDWAALEDMLDKHDKRGWMVYLRPLLSVAAALLFLLLGWWLYMPGTKNAGQVAVRRSVPSITSRPATNIAAAGRQPVSGIKHARPGILPVIERRIARSQTRALTPANRAVEKNENSGGGYLAPPAASNKTLLAALNPGTFINTGELKAPGLPEDINFEPVNKGAIMSNTKTAAGKISVKHTSIFQPRYAISVVGAPDLNSVSSFQQSKAGTNLGLVFSAGISKRFTITTGALYSVKPYTTSFSDYHSTAYNFAVNPVNVSANCRMLDIPLNINYLVYNKQRQKISFGTGLSSYIMLHEDYKFNYASSTATGPGYYDVPNSNKYFFGVLNLDATYERQLSPKVGFTVQPYLKLPLTNLGYSQVRLQSTGLAIGVSYSLNSVKKPE